MVPGYIMKLSSKNALTTSSKVLNLKNIKVYYINHHLSHASSFFFSSFNKASILTLDAFGEKQSGVFLEIIMKLIKLMIFASHIL